MFSALDYLREQNIVHRDIKSENILINPGTGEIKVADFGTAIKVDNSNNKKLPNDPTGTFEYMAPEVMENMLLAPGQWQSYGIEADMFSAGCLFYELLTGGEIYMPYSNTAEDLPSQCRHILDQQRDLGVRALLQKAIDKKELQIDPANQGAVVDLLAGMLEPDPKKRFTPGQAMVALSKIQLGNSADGKTKS